ncbi:hypothetical protein [Flavobacterium sp.]|uniref:hypothetical protein n=1 Tax=Flavobacterium sp. TaxID=239 RepID=UPI00286DB635|nr:hypothetical protein [Flavobacterium sp.]
MKKPNFTSFLFLLFFLSSCNSTQIVSSWTQRDKQINLNQLDKILVVAMFKSETSNRKAEDQMVGYLNGKGIPSYNYLKSNFNKENHEVIRSTIKNDGFDGVVTMRLIDVEQEKIYQQNNYNRYPNNYRDFNNYFYESSMSYYNPEYYITTKIYTIETNVYSIRENKIIWTALTETTDPKGVKKLTEEVTKVIYNQMIKDKFIK